MHVDNGMSFVFLLAVLSGLTGAYEMEFDSELADGFIKLEWGYDDSSITMKVSAATLGWIGFGISRTSTMENSDLIIMGVANGRGYLFDMYALSNGMPKIDDSQDVILENSTESDNRTTITFSRKLKTGDGKDNIIKGGPIRVLWAYGSDDKTADPLDSDYHGKNRGYRRMIILRKKKKKPTAQSSITTTSWKKEVISPDWPEFEFEGSQDLKHDLIYTATLDFDKTVYLRWFFDNTTVTFQVLAPTTGWISLGLERPGLKTESDIMLIGATVEGAYAWDAHAEHIGKPHIDGSQDLHVLSNWENSTHTMVTVERKRITCDVNDLEIEEGTYRVIWSYGAGDLTNDSIEENDYESISNGSRSLKLINPSMMPAEKKTSSKDKGKFKAFVVIRADKYSVPADDTHHMCMMFKFHFKKKHHITEFKPDITLGNEKRIRRIIARICEPPEDEQKIRSAGHCNTGPDSYLDKCQKYIAIWSTGMSAVSFPSDAGFAAGGSERTRFIMLEISYSNPDREEFEDSSGLRLYYTDKLRKHDIGVMSVSYVTNALWIPPRAENYQIQSYCSEKCIAKGMEISEQSEVSVFGVLFITHIAGKSVKLRHFRNGAELRPLAEDESYDAEYQEFQYKAKDARKIRQGDGLLMQCGYNTLNRQNATYGGIALTEEACHSYVFYYPKLQLDTCDSSAVLRGPIEIAALVEATNVSEVVNVEEIWDTITKNPNRLWDAFPQFDWTQKRVDAVEDFMHKNWQTVDCLFGNEQIEDHLSALKVPKYTEFMKKSVCPSKSSPATSLLTTFQPDESTTKPLTTAPFSTPTKSMTTTGAKTTAPFPTTRSVTTTGAMKTAPFPTTTKSVTTRQSRTTQPHFSTSKSLTASLSTATQHVSTPEAPTTNARWSTTKPITSRSSTTTTQTYPRSSKPLQTRSTTRKTHQWPTKSLITRASYTTQTHAWKTRPLSSRSSTTTTQPYPRSTKPLKTRSTTTQTHPWPTKPLITRASYTTQTHAWKTKPLTSKSSTTTTQTYPRLTKPLKTRSTTTQTHAWETKQLTKISTAKPLLSTTHTTPVTTSQLLRSTTKTTTTTTRTTTKSSVFTTLSTTTRLFTPKSKPPSTPYLSYTSLLSTASHYSESTTSTKSTLSVLLPAAAALTALSVILLIVKVAT